MAELDSAEAPGRDEGLGDLEDCHQNGTKGRREKERGRGREREREENWPHRKAQHLAMRSVRVTYL